MDVAGAEALRWRLAQQEHWQSAPAVRLGIQSSVDPDGHALESFDASVRSYRSEWGMQIVEGRTARVVVRLCKRLVEGAWHEDVSVE
jgi:hypothetical protein